MDPVSGGYECTRVWAEEKTGIRCGCPNCLRKDGLTLVFHAEDWNAEDDLREHWRIRAVSIKTGRMAPHLILPHYPGYDPVRYPEDMPGRYPGDTGSDDPP